MKSSPNCRDASWAIAVTCVAAVLSGTPHICTGQIHSPTHSPSEGSESSSRGLAAILLLTLKTQVANSAATSISNLAGGWFNWLLGFAKAPDGGTSPAPNLTGAAAYALVSQPVPTAPPTPEQQAQGVQSALQEPMLAIAARFLSGPEPNAPVHPLFGEVAIKSEASLPITLTVHSADVFAVHFTPTTPGLVRLTSIERGSVAVLDTYAVRPGQLNRLPREGAGGIVVDENVGTEVLRLEFEPCLPESFQSEPTLKPFIGKLGRCDQLMRTGAADVTAKGSRSGGVRGLALTVPQDGQFKNTGLIGAPKGYNQGQLLTYDISIDHKPRRI